MRKVISIVVILLFLVGCKAVDVENKSNQSIQKNKKKLNIVMSFGENETKVINEIVNEFEEKNNVAINIVKIQADNVVQELDKARNGEREIIDVIVQDNMQLYDLMYKDYMYNISDIENSLKDIIPRNLLSFARVKKKTYFIPFRPNVEIAIYNQEKFKEMNLLPPKNWQELYSVAKDIYTLEGQGKIQGIKAGDKPDLAVHLFDYIRSAGGDPMKLNDIGCIRAFEYLKKLEPYMSKEHLNANWNTTNKYLVEDEFYIAYNWPFAVNVVVKDNAKANMNVYTGWSGPVRESHVLGGDVIGVTADSQKKAIAKKFVLFMLSKDVQEKLTSQLGWLSIRNDAYEKISPWQQKYFYKYWEAMIYAKPRPIVPYWTEYQDILYKAYTEIVEEKQDAKYTLDKYANEMKGIKARYK